MEPEAAGYFANAVIVGRLADCAELPIVSVAVNLTENHRRITGVILVKVEAAEFLARLNIDYADEAVLYKAEMLLALFCLIDGNYKNDLVVILRHLCKVDEDLLVVAVASTGEVVTLVQYGSALMLQMPIVDNVRLIRYAAVAQQECSSVAVNILLWRTAPAAEQAAEKATATTALLLDLVPA